MRPVTQCKWHTEGTSKEVGHPEKRHQQPRKAHWGDPAACRLQHYNFGKASVSGHHPPSDEKRHTPSLYFISYPKSKWQDTLLVPKLHRITQTFCNPAVQQRIPHTPGRGITHSPQKHGLHFYLIMAGTVTHRLGLGEEEGGRSHRTLQPKPFADPTLPSPGGRRAGSDPPHFSLLLPEIKLCLCTFRSGSSRQKQLAEDSAISLSWNLKVYF